MMRHSVHPGRRCALLTAGAAAALLAAAPAAGAATVSATGGKLDFAAAPGEANHVVIATWGLSLKVTETGKKGATAIALTVGAGCWRLSTNSAACTHVPAVVNLGDGDDVIDLRDGVVDSLTCGAGNDSGDAETGDSLAPDCESVTKPAVPTDPVVYPVDPPVVDPPVVDPPVIEPVTTEPAKNSVPPTIPPQTVGISASGVATVLVSCPADSGGCSGTVAITLPAASSRRHARLSAAKKAAAVKLGSAKFKAAAGKSKFVPVRLSKRGRQRIIRRRSRRARITVTTRSAAGTTVVTSQDVTLRPPKAKKRRARRR
jgi:hypothetical protein